MELFIPVDQLGLDKESQDKQTEILKDWGGNVSWRTYTSYRATKILTETFEELEKNGKLERNKKKISTSNERKIILDYINTKKRPDTPFCLMLFRKVQNNEFCPPEDSSP